jgi:transposase InsO family protein
VLGQFFYLYLVMDIFSRKIIGYELAAFESSDLAAQMVRRLCLQEGIQKNQLFIHADNGGPMKGATMLATLRRLGVLPSFSRPSVSDDNAYSEALFKTLKYRPFYPRRPFASLEEATAWVNGFIRWYNHEHLHSGIRFVTPECKHRGEDSALLEKRKAVYESARQQSPERWTQQTRNWEPVDYVMLNPLKESVEEASLQIA